MASEGDRCFGIVDLVQFRKVYVLLCTPQVDNEAVSVGHLISRGTWYCFYVTVACDVMKWNCSLTFYLFWIRSTFGCIPIHRNCSFLLNHIQN